MAKPKQTTLADQFRQAIDQSGQTRYRIAQATGIDESALAKFYNGHRGLTLENLERLFEHLELQIVSKRQPKPKQEGQ
ncbi:hypothetical protein Pla8534_30040 [Lignipirellula cremea]|uniref:HTH cro/C1-type domain-containing protein n=1 Tax=Lignipirellula cremea TaxID=2528010 RepID=A0A518DTM3_9BACT|nr:hypothetical protein Pla8534_30040 [Lignipirellula cremea]